MAPKAKPSFEPFPPLLQVNYVSAPSYTNGYIDVAKVFMRFNDQDSKVRGGAGSTWDREARRTGKHIGLGSTWDREAHGAGKHVGPRST